jgi:Na+-driven multidrug efflux pump
MVAQNFGAEKYDRIRNLVYASLRICIFTSCVLMLCSVVRPSIVFGIFTEDAEVMEYCVPFMWIASLLYFLSSIQGAYQMVVTGVGNTKLAFVSGIMDGIVLRIGLGIVFGKMLGFEVIGFFLGTVLARLGPISISMIYYYSGKWKAFRKLT